MARPPKYKTPKELQEKIDEYFESGVKKIPLPVGKGDAETILEFEVPTITGLALYCEFESRQAFYHLENKEEFSYTIKKARLRIEQHYEESLQLSKSAAGPIFALKNLGWSDRQEIDHTSGGKPLQITGVKIINDGDNEQTPTKTD